MLTRLSPAVCCRLLLSPFLLVLLFVAAAFSAAAAEEAEQKLAAWKAMYQDKIHPIIESRCLECHRGEEAEGEFDLAPFVDGDSAAAQMDLWDRVAKRIRLNEMPPEGSPQLTDPQKSDFYRWIDSRPEQDLCNQLATDETQAWYRGHVMSRRLTRTEYTNAIRDLLSLELPAGVELPSDGGGGEGFDTTGDALFTSAIHVESYLAAADRLIEQAALDIATPSESLSEREAASQTLRQFARRAWRRPPQDAEIERLLVLFETERAAGANFVAAVRQPLKAILVSPHFLFVVESEPEEGGVQRLTPHQLAMRLSLFIWSSIPDEALLAAANSEEIYTPEGLRKQVRRMLADPRARALGENFGLQWLGLSNLATTATPDSELYPEFSSQLASDMREEAVRLVAGVFREDRPLLELIDADYVHANGTLAKHYQLDVPADAPWQRVALESRRRGGVITLGAVLTASSYPRRTSPVLRGRWILEEVLGSRVPPPPPGVPALEEAHEEGKKLSLRERLEVHRANPECASCHNRMDPLGFGLENFDAIGRWRTEDDGFPIDAAGKLPSGEAFSGPEELKQVLLRRQDEFQRHFIRKLLGFALGRGLNKFDDCVITDSLEALEANEMRAAVLIETIAASYPFQHRYFKAAAADPSAAAR
ncbi:DUF1592 domain-containing protein [Candidatus Laterigemmans baculatus]|uniref:DUF1592 domain-containing protein n=1 Tax=Candidatus Laterigemmans baculatus TaxID=2770505 RepID=UPI0013D9EB60|nr:DUF1592 domain-containing protein [Candidatus Laterigemmans baculatus]